MALQIAVSFEIIWICVQTSTTGFNRSLSSTITYQYCACDGCPIHPTRVDSSLVFAIQRTGNRFVNPIPYSWSGIWGWVENVVDSSRHESTEICGHVLRTRKVHVSLFYGSWLLVSYAGWVENVVDLTQFDRIDTNHFPCCRFVMPEVDLRDATPCESSRDITCESSRIVKCFRRIDSVSVYWTWMVPVKYNPKAVVDNTLYF